MWLLCCIEKPIFFKKAQTFILNHQHVLTPKAHTDQQQEILLGPDIVLNESNCCLEHFHRWGEQHRLALLHYSYKVGGLNLLGSFYTSAGSIHFSFIYTAPNTTIVTSSRFIL